MFQKIIIFLISLFLLSACNNIQEIRYYEHIKIKKENDTQKYNGIIKTKNSTLLSFQNEGVIKYFPYTKGDFIKKGTTIAKLDNTLQEIKKNEENARLKEYYLQKEKQEKYYKRLNILHSEGAISDNDWESANYEFQILAQKIKIQKEKINYIDKELSNNNMISPFDGYISRKFSDVDSYIKKGSPIIELISSKDFQVEIMVGENIVNNLFLEQIVAIECQNKKYKGKIKNIARSSLESGGYLIKISIKDDANILKEGMNAKVEFLNSNNKNLYLPLKYIVFENDNKFAYKLIEIKNGIGKIIKVPIEIGKIADEKIEIISGVYNNDIIILCNDNKCANKKGKI